MTGREEAALHAIEILGTWGGELPVEDTLAEERLELLVAVVQEMAGGGLSPDRMAACRRLIDHLTASPRCAARLARPLDAV